MLENGLIGKTLSGKRILYIAENPDILSQYLENIKQDFDTFLPEIKKHYQNAFQKPIFRHLQGFE